MNIKFGTFNLSYDSEEEYPDGEYELILKQDKLLPLYTKKMLKQGLENPEMDNPKNLIKVSAYDEDMLGDKLLTYVQVNGFEHYCSFVVKNNFSVYKMPKFELFVPREAVVLKKD